MAKKKSQSHTGRNIAIGCAIAFVVSIPIFAVLVAIVLIAINPAGQFAKAQDTKRKADALQVVNAVWMYAADNNEEFPIGLTTTPTDVATICSDLVPQYIDSLPTDPSISSSAIGTNCSTITSTGYLIFLDPTGKVTVQAPQAKTEPIEVSQ